MAVSKATQEIYLTIPKQNFGNAIITIEGTSPLVTNPFPVKAKEQIKTKQNTAKADRPKAKEYDQRFPWEDFSNAGYWITTKPMIKEESDWLNLLKKETPRFGFQVSGVKDSALQAAMRLGMVKNLPTARMYFSIVNDVMDTLYGQSIIEILSPEPPILREDCLSTFNSGADMRYRMMFKEWKMDLEISYLADFINIETIVHWFSLGGRGVGIGENRPEKGGPWGTYQVSAG